MNFHLPPPPAPLAGTFASPALATRPPLLLILKRAPSGNFPSLERLISCFNQLVRLQATPISPAMRTLIAIPYI